MKNYTNLVFVKTIENTDVYIDYDIRTDTTTVISMTKNENGFLDITIQTMFEYVAEYVDKNESFPGFILIENHVEEHDKLFEIYEKENIITVKRD